MSDSLPDASTNVQWMYEGKNSSIDREAYLLGKRITKVEEDKGDFVVEKKQNENLSVSVLEKLDYESKVREDPLFAIKKKEEDRRRELLSNPVKRKHLQNTLKSALLKDLESTKKHKKRRLSPSDDSRRRRKHKKRYSSSSSSDTSSDDSLHDKHSSKKLLKNAHKDKDLHAALKKALERDLKGNRDLSSSSEEYQHVSSKKEKTSKKHKKHSKEQSPRKLHCGRDSSPPAQSHKESKYERHHKEKLRKEKKNESSCTEHKKGSKEKEDFDKYKKPKPEGYGLIVVKPQDSNPKRKSLKSLTPPPVKEKYVRKQKSGFTKKLSKEDLEKKRREMMENADWRDDQRKKNVKSYNDEEEFEIKRESHIRNLRDGEIKKHGKVKTFLHDMKLKQASHGSLEDTVRRKRHKLERVSND